MILKKFKYNEYSLRVDDRGGIVVINNNYLFLIIEIADFPIINELTKELFEYYMEWLICQCQS